MLDVFRACMVRCPRGQRQQNRHLIIAYCMPLRASPSPICIQPPHKKLYSRPTRSYLYLATFFINIQQTSFAPKSGWGMLVYAPGWTLPSQFRSYTAPPKSWFFRGQKNAIFRQHIHIEKCCFCLLVSAQKIQAPKKKCFFFLGRIFGENMSRRFKKF